MIMIGKAQNSNYQMKYKNKEHGKAHKKGVRGVLGGQGRRFSRLRWRGLGPERTTLGWAGTWGRAGSAAQVKSVQALRIEVGLPARALS